MCANAMMDSSQLLMQMENSHADNAYINATHAQGLLITVLIVIHKDMNLLLVLVWQVGQLMITLIAWLARVNIINGALTVTTISAQNVKLIEWYQIVNALQTHIQT
jgi:hypothetical protein